MAPQPGCKGEPIGLDCSHQRANVRQLSIFIFHECKIKYPNSKTSSFQFLFVFQKIFEESIDSQVGFHSVLCDSWHDFEVDFN